jgi:hypothetical protein
MFPPMKAAHKLVVLGVCAAAALSALAAAPPTRAATSQPTPKQIKAAVRQATRSKLVWATINTCGFHGDSTVGVRGEMPALAFPAHLLMVVTVQEWSSTRHRYVPIKGTWKLGGQAFTGGSLVQEGLKLTFGAKVRLIATIDFEWFRDGKLLGSTTRTTTAGHRDAKGLPSGYSVATCSLG